MQTYFLHPRDREDIPPDPDGRVFPSMEALVAATLYEGRDVTPTMPKAEKSISLNALRSRATAARSSTGFT
jgi:hypothetical protein